MNKQCHFCYFRCIGNENLMQHMSRYHRGQFHVQCNVPNCEAVYNNWYSFKNHVSWKHRRNRYQRQNVNVPVGQDQNNFILLHGK